VTALQSSSNKSFFSTHGVVFIQQYLTKGIAPSGQVAKEKTTNKNIYIKKLSLILAI
jgi:hypothetical protein